MRQRTFDIDEIEEYCVVSFRDSEMVYSTLDRIKLYAFRKCAVERPAGGLRVVDENNNVVYKILPRDIDNDEENSVPQTEAHRVILDHIGEWGQATAAGLTGVYRMLVSEDMTEKQMLAEMIELTSARHDSVLTYDELRDGTMLFRFSEEKK